MENDKGMMHIIKVISGLGVTVCVLFVIITIFTHLIFGEPNTNDELFKDIFKLAMGAFIGFLVGKKTE